MNASNPSRLPVSDPLVNIYVGDVLDGLRALPAESVQCCVTSPPYFGLRSYLPDAVRVREDLTSEERAFLADELSRLGVRPINADV